jgi:hypothetical protein
MDLEAKLTLTLADSGEILAVNPLYKPHQAPGSLLQILSLVHRATPNSPPNPDSWRLLFRELPPRLPLTLIKLEVP